MFNKTKIFNLALNALLLTKEVTNADTDDSTEAGTLRKLWDVAVGSFLEESNLDEISETVKLVLVANNPNSKWLYAYRYPTDCVYLRRIDTELIKDSKTTQVIRKTGKYNGEKVIFTNKEAAYAEVIRTEEEFLECLSNNAALALAHKLAYLSTPLIAQSTDPSKLKKSLDDEYQKFKSLAEAKDFKENFNYDTPEEESEISQARMS